MVIFPGPNGYLSQTQRSPSEAVNWEPSISIGPLKDQELMAKGDDLSVERGSSPFGPPILRYNFGTFGEREFR
jgi:hypothetical protein